MQDQADVVVMPTDYFNPVVFQTDNTDFDEATAAFGIPMAFADSMTMDNTNPFPPGTSGVVHVLEDLDDDCLQLTYDIECLLYSGWFRNPTTITFEERSALVDLVGTGYSGFGFSPNLSCDVTITRDSN